MAFLMLIFTIKAQVPDEVKSEQAIEFNIAAEAVTLNAQVIEVFDFSCLAILDLEDQIFNKNALFEKKTNTTACIWQEPQLDLIRYRAIDINNNVSKNVRKIQNSSGGLPEAPLG